MALMAVETLTAQMAPKSHTVNGVVYATKSNGDR